MHVPSAEALGGLVARAKDEWPQVSFFLCLPRASFGVPFLAACHRGVLDVVGGHRTDPPCSQGGLSPCGLPLPLPTPGLAWQGSGRPLTSGCSLSPLTRTPEVPPCLRELCGVSL